MKKSLLILALAAVLLTGCDGPTKVLTSQISGELKSVSADTRHTMTLDTLGNLYANGYNEVGALGDGIALLSTTLVPVKVSSGVESVDTGYNFTMVVKEGGTLWGTGANGLGQLGIGTTVDVAAFTQARDVDGNLMTNVASVYTGNGFTLALKKDGTLWGSGQNYHGQLGIGNNVDQSAFKQITGLAATVSKVATGDYHSMILLSNGDILTTGDNWFGALGNTLGGAGTGTNVFTKVTDTGTVGTVVDLAAGNAASFIVNSLGEVYVTGDNWRGAMGTASNHVFAKLSGVTTAVDVEAKYTSASITTSDNKLLITGHNSHGQAGLGVDGVDIESNVAVFTEASTTAAKGDRKAAVGDYTSFYISTTNDLYGAGDNWFANLGNGLAGAGTGYNIFTKVTE